MKTLNKDTPLINSNINESNLADKISKIDGKVLLLCLLCTLYMYIELILIINLTILLDFGKDQNLSKSPLPNNRTISFNNTPRPIPKEHLKCNILKGDSLFIIFVILETS